MIYAWYIHAQKNNSDKLSARVKWRKVEDGEGHAGVFSQIHRQNGFIWDFSYKDQGTEDVDEKILRFFSEFVLITPG